jgi:hypothetical protein
MKVNPLKVKEIVNKLNEGQNFKSKQEIIRQITNQVRTELPSEIYTAILNISNTSIEEPSFYVELVINGEQEFELDNRFAYDLIKDVVALKVLSNKEVLELYEDLFYGDYISEEDVTTYRYNYLVYLDESSDTITFFLGGEDEHVMKFDLLDNLKSLNGFTDGIEFTTKEDN